MSGKWISIGRSPLLTLRESATVTESTFRVLRSTRICHACGERRDSASDAYLGAYLESRR
jgi:hypothetical protein